MRVPNSLAQTVAVAFIYASSLTQPVSADDKPSDLYANFTAANLHACMVASVPTITANSIGPYTSQAYGTAAGLSCTFSYFNPKLSRDYLSDQSCHFEGALDAKGDSYLSLDVTGQEVTVFFGKESRLDITSYTFDISNGIRHAINDNDRRYRKFPAPRAPAYVLNAVTAAREACPDRAPLI